MEISIGSKVNLWEVTAGPTQKYNRIKHWVCTCTCGNTKEVAEHKLRNDLTYSCGCTHRPVTEKTRELLRERSTGQTKSQEAKAKISLANKGRKRPEGWTPWTPERIARQAAKVQGASK